jgi:hypothetical protein
MLRIWRADSVQRVLPVHVRVRRMENQGGAMQEITLSSTVVVGPRQVSTELGEEVVVLGAEAGQYFGLNEVAARVWALLQSPITVAALCDGILAEFEVEQDACRSDVLELLRDLHAKGLIDVRAEVGSP